MFLVAVARTPYIMACLPDISQGRIMEDMDIMNVHKWLQQSVGTELQLF